MSEEQTENLTAVQYLLNYIHFDMRIAIPKVVKEEALRLEKLQLLNNGEYCAVCGSTEIWNYND